MPVAPNAPGLRVRKVGKHTDISRHREHAGEPASRAPECLGLLRISPVDIPPPLWSSASSASLSGEFGGEAPGLRDARPARRDNTAWAADDLAPRARKHRTQTSSPHDGSRGRTPLARAGTDRNIGL